VNNKNRLLEIQKLVKRASLLGKRICDNGGVDFSACEECPAYDPDDLCVSYRLEDLKKSVDMCIKRMKKGGKV